jgi:hypothetical protein
VGLSYGIASGALSLFFTVSRFWKGKMKPCQLAAHHSRAIAGGQCLSFVAGLRHGGRGLTRGQIAENHPSNYGKLAGGVARPSASKTPSRNRPGSRSSSLAS